MMQDDISLTVACANFNWNLVLHGHALDAGYVIASATMLVHAWITMHGCMDDVIRLWGTGYDWVSLCI